MELNFDIINNGTIPEIRKHLKEVYKSIHGNDLSSTNQKCRDLVNAAKEFNLVFNEQGSCKTIISDYQASIQVFLRDMDRMFYQENGRHINPQTEGFMVPSETLYTFVMCSTVFQFFRDLKYDKNLYTDFLECIVNIDYNLTFVNYKGELGIYDDCWLSAIKAIIYGCADYDYFYDRMVIYINELYNTNKTFSSFIDEMNITPDNILHSLKIFTLSREVNDLYVDTTNGSHEYDDTLQHDSQLISWNVDKFGESLPTSLVGKQNGQFHMT